MKIKAILFDLHGTLAYVPNPISDESVSDILVKRGYDVFPQAWDAAWHYVGFVDYPKYGYKTRRSFIRRVLNRLRIEPDSLMLTELVKLHAAGEWIRYPDVVAAFRKAKEAGLKTAIITTIARFNYRKALKPVWNQIDLLVDGYTFHCEKSNPKIYLKALETLNVKPHEAVMIGDDMQLDIMLPKSLGINTILLNRKGGDRGQSVDAFVYSLTEAMEIIIRDHRKN
jgi:putative hydrolase of the HAD superfamily